MSITITAVSPAAGHTGGRTLVEIDGTGFPVPAPGQVVSGIVQVPPPTLTVLFGGVPAREVRVVSPTLLYAVTPIGGTFDAQGAPIPVDVTVQALDDRGLPTPDVAVAARAFTYLRPDLTTEAAESDLVRLVRSFIDQVRLQVTPNFVWPVNTDFDDTTQDFLSVSKLPSLPGLVIVDANLRENAFYSLRDQVEIDNGDGTFTLKRPPDTVDIVLTIVGISNASAELLNLSAAWKMFLKKNPYLAMARDPADAAKGQVQYELSWSEGTDLKFVIQAGTGNLKHFAYTVAIVGFDIEEMPGLPAGGPGDSGRAHEGTVDTGQPIEGDVGIAATLKLA